MIGGNYQKMYFHDPRLLHVYTDGNTISTEVSSIFFIHEVIFDEDITFFHFFDQSQKRFFCEGKFKSLKNWIFLRPAPYLNI